MWGDAGGADRNPGKRGVIERKHAPL